MIVASRIPAAIEPRAFEKIRDRIVEILVVELAHQTAITYNEVLDADVYRERSVPFDKTDLPAVNVAVAKGDFNNASLLQKDGNYVYHIDCFTRAKTDDDEGGDAKAMLKLHSLMGVCDAIISDHQYKTLGFAPPFLSGRRIEEMQIAEPKRNEDAESIMMGRLTLIVRVPETVNKLPGTLIVGYETQVKIDDTEKGYIYIGGTPL